MGTGLTRGLVQGLLRLAEEPLPPGPRNAAERSLLNVLGTAVGGSRHPAVDLLTDNAHAHGGVGRFPIPGRSELLDALNACTAIGVAAHVDDFDDTHLETVIHPGASTLGAVWTMGADRRATGDHILRAFALGIESQLRIGLAMSPWHYNDGWHITGTCGAIGAAVAAGLLAGLDEDLLTQAIGIAASQTLGIRESFGTMMKPFHPGKAASNGVLAVLLAEQGFTGSSKVLEASRGFLAVLSPSGYETDRVLEDLGHRWELERNTFKPYPCGIVSHPAIDGAIELSGHIGNADDVVSIVARVHPLVLELTGNLDPKDGLQARFSTAHGIAAGLIDGHVGLAQFTDERVVSGQIATVRRRVRFEIDKGCPRDSATIELELRSGKRISHHVPHARGSLDRPLTDEELVEKVKHLIEPKLPGATRAIVNTVRGLVAEPTVEYLVAACTPPKVAA